MTQLLLGKQGPSTVCRPDHSNTLREREGECEVQQMSQYVGGHYGTELLPVYT